MPNGSGRASLDYNIIMRTCLSFIALLVGLASTAVAADPSPPTSALVATLQPAVVNLSITRHTKEGGGPNLVGQSTVTAKKVQGSGFIIDPAGIIVTNRHTIADATDIIVTLNDTTRLRATVLAAAIHSDIALLKVHAGKALPALHLGNSAELLPGDPILVAGNPLGFGSTFTSGIISALNRVRSESETGSYFQVDAPLNPGNSGGPVFNMAGDVVGISTAFLSPGNDAGSVGLGLAIPSDEARIVIARLEKNGRDRVASIGIRVQPVTDAIAATAGLPAVSASIVTQVDADGPAAKSGLESGDIIEAIDRNDGGSPQKLDRTLGAASVGDVIEIGIWRDGERLLIPVTTVAFPGDDKTSATVSEKAPVIDGDQLGLVLGPLTRDAREKIGMAADDTGVLVEDVQAGSIAWDRGILAGAAILKVDRQPVTSPAEAQRSIDNVWSTGRRSLLLLVQDGDGRRWVALTM